MIVTCILDIDMILMLPGYWYLT